MDVISHITLILLFGSLFQIVSSTTYSCSSSDFCGCSANSATLTKIVGGQNAASQTWGWAASLRYVYTGSHFCGGSIISSLHILTAAHCTVDKYASSIRVYVGSISLSQTVQSRSVSKIYVHPSYSSTTHLNDISILKLSSPLDFSTPGVDLICLPIVAQSALNNEEYPAPNTTLVAIGWGVTSQGSQTVSSVLQQVTIQSVAATSTYCRNSRIASASTQMCAGNMPSGGKDTCQGDSGGPLMLFKDQRWQQVGITSVGVGCAQAGYPGIYTRVVAYQSWINSTMNDANQICTISYTTLFSILLLILF